MSTLTQESLHRIRYRGGRVIFDEQIYIGLRIRDLDQLANGTIVLWADDTSLVELKPANSTVSGAEGFIAAVHGLKQQQARGTIETCQMCHAVTPNGAEENAPNLWGVFGRRIAGTAFAGYSEALKNRTGVWNETTLDAFLKDVEGFCQGCNMMYPGISDDEIRLVTIEYLKSLSGP